jgi:Holliday junction resolvase RusA-like endonuclease
VQKSNLALDAWEEHVRMIATVAANASEDPKIWPWGGAVYVNVMILFKRPQNQFRTGKFSHLLRDDAPEYPTTRGQGDFDKLERAINDALTGPLFPDDSQNIGPKMDIKHGKRWGEHDAVWFRVEAI